MSDIKVNCPHCKQSLEVPEELFGTIAECPSCNGQIQLPSRQAETRPNTPTQQTKALQPKQSVIVQPTQPSAISSKALFIVVSALIIVVLGLVTTVVYLLNSQHASSQLVTESDSTKYHSQAMPVKQTTPAKPISESGSVDGGECIIKGGGQSEGHSQAMPVKQTTPAKQISVPGSVEGGAWVIKGGGQSDVLRGLTVYILPAAINTQAIAPQLEELREDCERNEKGHAETAQKWANDENMKESVPECREKQKMMRTIGDAVKNMLASKQEVKSKEIYDFIRADDRSSIIPFLGVSFDKIWPKTVAATAIASGTTGIDGKYSVSNLAEGDYILYAQAAAAKYIIEWCVPVTVKAGQITKVDLFNENAALAINDN